jgi:hypothetical protein
MEPRRLPSPEITVGRRCTLQLQTPAGVSEVPVLSSVSTGRIYFFRKALIPPKAQRPEVRLACALRETYPGSCVYTRAEGDEYVVKVIEPNCTAKRRKR